MSHSYWKEYADLCADTFSGQDEAQYRALDVLDKADRQIAALRAKLEEWETRANTARTLSTQYMEERDRLAAQVEELTRERDHHSNLCDLADARCAALYADQIDRLKADLAAMTERAERAEAHRNAAIIATENTHAKLMAVPCCREGTATEIGQAHTRIRDLERELQRATERAEKAEAEIDRKCQELKSVYEREGRFSRERDAARAEADALRASRDKLAGLLRERGILIDDYCNGCGVDTTKEPHHPGCKVEAYEKRIKAALAEVGGSASSELLGADGRAEEGS